MLSYENDELIVIKTCPRCAKAQRGRGILSTENRFLNEGTGTYIECLLCGWFGDERQCHEYCFPCDVERLVVMDLEVVENLWAFALRDDEPAKIDLYNGEHYEVLPPFDIREKDCRDRLMKVDLCPIETALKIMVARGCLLPGVYKIKC